MSLSEEEIPAYVRRCYENAKVANQRNREAEIERLRFYVGGDLQWREEELNKRRQSGRPWVTINKCKPAVDQIEGDIRINPPGPQCHPVGGGADKDTADIIEGLIREVEYRSGAKTAYSTAGKYVATSGYAVIELCTEWANNRTLTQQRLRIQSIEDPSNIFFDPTARMANRQDAAWAGKLKMYNKEEYKAAFGKKRKVLQGRGIQSSMGWIQSAMGIDGNLAQINEWTGGLAGEGPYYVAEFYMVQTDSVKLTLYDNNIAYFEDETPPETAQPKPGPEYTRMVPRRKIIKYLVDALEVLDTTEWPGTLIPLFPVLGPEVYIDGKLHRLSVIAGAIDAQRGLNFAASSATEMAGLVSKAPWIGPRGTFDDPRWENANTEPYAYLEYTPVFITNDSGQQVVAPPPQRNSWEAAIQWALALGQYFSDAIKAVTSIYDASLGREKSNQSGVAIEQLRSESNVGNFSYSDNLHRAIEVMYGEMCCIFPKIMDSSQVAIIVKPDSQHEGVQINQDFSGTEGIDPSTGKKGKANNICIGEYTVRVIAGPSYPTRQLEAIKTLIEFFKTSPQALAVPGVAPRFLRLLGDGNPQVEAMADLLMPAGQGEEENPAQTQAKMVQMQQENQKLMGFAKQLHEQIEAQLPKIEADKWKAALAALTNIKVAEIKAGVDNTALEVKTLEHITGMAHETAMQATEHEHAASQSQMAAEQEPIGESETEE